MDIVINWNFIKSEEDFYNLFLEQIKAPEWHGRNLDALSDSVIVGDIGCLEPPYKIINKNISSIPENLSAFQLKVLEIFNEGIVANRGIEVVSS